MIAPSTIDLLRHLAGKPGHDEVKADFRDLLIDEFGAELSALDFERRVPVVRGRLDALIGRTVFESKRDLAKELAGVERKMPDYLGDREREEGEKFVGIASDGRQWITYELEDGKLIKIKEIILDLQKSDLFLAWLDGVAALSRGQFERLRSGSFMSARIAWDEVWTMDDSVQPLFPVPSCVVFGRRRATSKPFPDKVRASGTLPFRDAPEEIADRRLKVREDARALDIANFEGGSPYRKMFRQGDTLLPRMLCLVERRTMGRLGADPSAPYVASRRTNQEKESWKSLPAIENRVEAEFLRPVLLGESILPYRVFQPFDAVVPVTDKGEMLDAEAAANRGFDDLHGWMKKAEKLWNVHRASDINLAQQFDYYGKLSAQFPLASLRLVYSKAGTNPAACVLRSGLVRPPYGRRNLLPCSHSQ
ncbi:MAG: hypothetical protein WA624_01690 [Methylocella sp.]